MENPMLPQEAAVFDKYGNLTLREIVFLTVSLAYLIGGNLGYGFFPFLLGITPAFLLLLITEEDARAQTIDVRNFLCLAASLLSLAVLQGRFFGFLCGIIDGTACFCLLRSTLSFLLTWLEEGNGAASGSAEATIGVAPEPSRMGYVPLFMFVYVLYLGFGTEWAAIVFQQSSAVTEIVGELLELFPWIEIIAALLGFILLWWERRRIHRKQTFVCAFGDGDVVFLGLFTAWLGGGTLLALFFLSLIAQALWMGTQTVLHKLRANEERDAF